VIGQTYFLLNLLFFGILIASGRFMGVPIYRENWEGIRPGNVLFSLPHLPNSPIFMGKDSWVSFLWPWMFYLAGKNSRFYLGTVFWSRFFGTDELRLTGQNLLIKLPLSLADFIASQFMVGQGFALLCADCFHSEISKSIYSGGIVVLSFKLFPIS